MYLALRKAGVPAELHVYATAAHDFGVRPSDHPCSTWTQACAAWLRYQGFLKLSAQTHCVERFSLSYWLGSTGNLEFPDPYPFVVLL